MKVPTPQYRCPLGRLQPQATDLDAIKRNVAGVTSTSWWSTQSDERLDFIEREIVRRIGERLYGGARHD